MVFAASLAILPGPTEKKKICAYAGLTLLLFHVATTVLGILRRAVQEDYRAWARHQRKARDSTCQAFLEKMGRRVNLVVRYLIGEVFRL